MRYTTRLVVMLAVLAALAIPAVAQAPAAPTICCQDSQGAVVQISTDACPAGTVKVDCPAPPETVPAWWAAIKEWLSGKILYEATPDMLVKILGILASFLAIVQGIKKFLESAAKWSWLLKLIPNAGPVLDWVAHGWGPVVINGLITGGTMLVAAMQDGKLTGGELLGILAAVLGTDLLYKLVRGTILPKTVIPAK
jgi:hypothetical protein